MYSNAAVVCWRLNKIGDANEDASHRKLYSLHYVAIVTLNMDENVGNRIRSAARVAHVREKRLCRRKSTQQNRTINLFIDNFLHSSAAPCALAMGEAKRRICGLWSSSNYIMANE